MSMSADVPYADLESMSELAEECRCVEAECEAHGVHLHQHPHQHQHHEDHLPAQPVVIGETAEHLVDGLDDYGC